jgi:hypothetical protein
MGSWIKPNTYTGIPKPEPDIPIVINGFTFKRPSYFKNKAHARAFELALGLATKKPLYTYTQKMGDIIIEIPGPVIMTTSECIDIMMFGCIPAIKLSLDVSNPRCVAHDAMKLVKNYFPEGQVKVEQRKIGRHEYYLELKR